MSRVHVIYVSNVETGDTALCGKSRYDADFYFNYHIAVIHGSKWDYDYCLHCLKAVRGMLQEKAYTFDEYSRSWDEVSLQLEKAKAKYAKDYK